MRNRHKFDAYTFSSFGGVVTFTGGVITFTDTQTEFCFIGLESPGLPISRAGPASLMSGLPKSVQPAKLASPIG